MERTEAGFVIVDLSVSAHPVPSLARLDAGVWLESHLALPEFDEDPGNVAGVIHATMLTSFELHAERIELSDHVERKRARNPFLVSTGKILRDDAADVDDILSEPFGHGQAVDVRRLDAKVTDVEWPIGAKCESLDGFAGARVDQIVLGQKGLEASEEGLELGRTVNVGLGDACEGCAEIRELWTPDGLDIGTEFIDNFEGACSAVLVAVGPLEQNHGPFDDLVGPVKASTLDTGCLDIKREQILEGLLGCRRRNSRNRGRDVDLNALNVGSDA